MNTGSTFTKPHYNEADFPHLKNVQTQYPVQRATGVLSWREKWPGREVGSTT